VTILVVALVLPGLSVCLAVGVTPRFGSARLLPKPGLKIASSHLRAATANGNEFSAPMEVTDDDLAAQDSGDDDDPFLTGELPDKGKPCIARGRLLACGRPLSLSHRIEETKSGRGPPNFKRL
jgi:hypothetical protein